MSAEVSNFQRSPPTSPENSMSPQQGISGSPQAETQSTPMSHPSPYRPPPPGYGPPQGYAHYQYGNGQAGPYGGPGSPQSHGYPPHAPPPQTPSAASPGQGPPGGNGTYPPYGNYNYGGPPPPGAYGYGYESGYPHPPPQQEQQQRQHQQQQQQQQSQHSRGSAPPPSYSRPSGPSPPRTQSSSPMSSSPKSMNGSPKSGADSSDVDRLRAAAAEELHPDDVKPIRTDFHFFVQAMRGALAKLAEEEVRRSMGNPAHLDPVLVNTNLNTRLMKAWEDAAPNVRHEYMAMEEADRKRFMEEDEIASRHCATLTARGKSPRADRRSSSKKQGGNETDKSSVLETPPRGSPAIDDTKQSPPEGSPQSVGSSDHSSSNSSTPSRTKDEDSDDTECPTKRNRTDAM